MGNTFSGSSGMESALNEEGHIVTGSESSREGLIDEAQTADYTTQALLHSMVKELRIMNIHLSQLTDSWISRQEVE